MKHFIRAIELMLGVGRIGQVGVRGQVAQALVRDALAAIAKDLRQG